MFALEEFLGMVLREMSHDLAGTVGADISALRPRRPHHPPVTLATCGLAPMLHELQPQHGPMCSAAAAHGPVVSNDLWHDQRWPTLSLGYASERFPSRTAELRTVRGCVCLPGLNDDGSLIIMSAYLSGKPDPDTVDVMQSYERLVTAAVTATSAFSGTVARTRRVLDILGSREELQQATGVVMCLCRTDALTATSLLHDIGKRAQVPPSALASELVRVVGSPPEIPGAEAVAHPKARRLAEELLLTLGPPAHVVE